MRTKHLAGLMVVLLFWVTVPARACCEGDPPGNPACYECRDGAWVLKSGAECGGDLDCEYGGEGCEVCRDCLCKDDDSKCNAANCETCVGGVCTSPTTCYGYAQTDIYQGSCVCGIDGIVTCKSNDDELRSGGIGKICTHERTCITAPPGVQGRTECDPDGARGNVCDVWTCRDDMCLPGVILCWELNVLVCTIECYAAATACAANPGSPECSQGLEDCFQCLTKEGVECGCIVIQCGYDYAGYVEGDTVLLSGCPCVGR